MPKREIFRIRQSTNLYDVLDDGIENGSDLPELAKLRPCLDGAEQAHSVSPRPAAKVGAAGAPGTRSWGGVLIGAALTVGGTAAATWPAEMIVWHSRMRYLPDVAEHVTSATARWYGVVVCLTGLVVVAFSLVRMRNHALRT